MWIGYMNIVLINFDLLIRLLRRHGLKGNLHHILSSIAYPNSLKNLDCTVSRTPSPAELTVVKQVSSHNFKRARKLPGEYQNKSHFD